MSNHSHNTGGRRPSKSAIAARTANYYLLTWVEIDPATLDIVSHCKSLDSIVEVKECFQWAVGRQIDSLPDEDAMITYLPYPRVHCFNGAMRELNEAGYEYVMESPSAA
jgi:hypothetical protein